MDSTSDSSNNNSKNIKDSHAVEIEKISPNGYSNSSHNGLDKNQSTSTTNMIISNSSSELNESPSNNDNGENKNMNNFNSNLDKNPSPQSNSNNKNAGGGGGFFKESETRRLRKLQTQKQHERAIELTRLSSQYKLSANSTSSKIINLDWNSLVKSLQSREISAVQVLEAYIGKATEVTSIFNSISEFIPQAHEWAKELDNLKEIKGPLHGIPICIKDDTNVEGMDATHGYAKRLYNPAKESAVLVKVLQDLGAVPFCKTNIPQTMFTYGSDNPVFGTTTSAVNAKLSPGGSSSGTGSLVGSHGCMFGTGTDIGGSLRIPAHFNGCSSIKPTNGRISLKGVTSSLPKLAGLIVSPGIIGRTPTVVANVVGHILDKNRQSFYDPLVYPIPWDAQTFNSTKKLRVGYFTSIPFFPCIGDTNDVILEAKESLESLGHTLVPFPISDGFDFMNTMGRILLADGSKHFTEMWKGEQVATSVKLMWLGSKIPACLRKIIASLMNCKYIPFLYSKRTSVLFGASITTTNELWDTIYDKNEFTKQLIDEWTKLELDSLICPVFPTPALPVDDPAQLPTAVCYTALWNLVDFPAGVVPFGYESGKKIDAFDHEGDLALKLAKKGIKESISSPISVQVVGLPFKEEIVLRVMQELEKVKSTTTKKN